MAFPYRKAFYFDILLYMEPTLFKRLGWKTFMLFVVQKAGLFFATLLLIVALLIGSQLIPAQYSANLTNAYPYLFLALIVFFATSLLLGWLKYIHYSMALSDDDIKITTGLITEEEVGVPYRRIKEVKIERDLVDEVLGLSDIVIIVQGEEDITSGTMGHVLLPHIDKNIAIQIQNKLLGKAEIEEMKIDKS